MSSYITKKTPGDTSWFTQDRFGMFIHFGLYSMPARHEWIQTLEEMPHEKYERYFKYFNPDLFEPKEWAKAAKKAGMKYAVLTAKHHEGFCLFDSKYTDYKVTNTPFGRDIVKAYAEAFRAEGIRVGLYYSLIDWHHPDFTIDRNHPYRSHPDAVEMNKSRDMKKYAAYMRNQVTELLTNYGEIDILWFDFSYPPIKDYPAFPGKGKEDWEAEKLIETARKIRPNIIINNRAGLEQDVWSPEQYQPTDWLRHGKTGEPVVWEACQTFSGSWGYHRDEHTWKTPAMLIEMLVKTVSRGGNLLMNVGPTPRGVFDSRATEALDTFGEWMRFNSRSIYGCTMAEPEFSAPAGCYLTQSTDEKRLYIHIFDYPFKYLHMLNMAGKIEYAQFLHDGSEILYTEGGLSVGRGNAWEDMQCNEDNGEIVFSLPHVPPKGFVPVIEVFLK